MLATYETTPAAPAGPTKEAVLAYRELVFDHVDQNRQDQPDPAVLEAAWRLPIDFATDAKNYRRRLDAKRDLDEKVPRLAQNARRLADIAAQAARIGSKPVSDFRTLDALLTALLEVQNYRSGPNVSPQKLAAAEAASLPSMVANGARIVLSETGDPAIARALSELHSEIRSLESGIRSRDEILNVDVAIVRAEARIHDLATNQRGFTAESARDTRTATKQLYAEARQRLAQLRQLAAQKPAAEQANKADQVRIAELRAKIDELNREALEPQKMCWHE
jgi:hypothetical protein